MPLLLEFYRGREQTYVKHLFLEKYLERVAYHILWRQDDFVYVDGFSGPWKSEDQDLDDTSFMIAIKQLRRVRDDLRDRRGKRVRLRCYFNDKNIKAYHSLVEIVNDIDDIEIKVKNRSFEDLVSDIAEYIGDSFSLTFIDPVGWTGYNMQKIRPILIKRGEVIINFMYDRLNPFLEDPRLEIASSFDGLFGGSDWFAEYQARVDEGLTREQALLDTYRERLRTAGSFDYVTSTRILKPVSDRAYFHLVYCTRHWKGLREFRKVEKRWIKTQEGARHIAKSTHREARTGQRELFSSVQARTGPASYEAERNKQREIAITRLKTFLAERKSVTYKELLSYLLQMPLVWESDIKLWITDMRKARELEIPELTGRQHVPKDTYRLIWTGS